ncbi:MAG: Flp pilus assembly protein CpaB [Firmicutes bacterium]|nr:Flp pilus assembly protein CpaB [Bacillota bacterium]
MARRQMLVALAVALVASALTYGYISSISESEEVVVASGDIPAGARVLSQMVKLFPVAKRSVHPSAFRKKEDVVGKFTTQTIVAGEQVLKNRIAAGEYAGTTAGLPGESRAMFVPVQDVKAVGGAIRAGERVDVIFVSQEQKAGASASRCVLRSVPVIGTGRGEHVGGKQSRAFSTGIDSRPEGVLLAVTPRDAERLAFCLENGHVYLVAVPFGAPAVQTQGVTWKDLFDPPVQGISPSSAQ